MKRRQSRLVLPSDRNRRRHRHVTVVATAAGLGVMVAGIILILTA